MDFLGVPQEMPSGDSDVNIEVSNGPIYVSPRMSCGNPKSKQFSNTMKVSVPRMSNLRFVYVLRGHKYVPTFNIPEFTDLDTLTFFFNKPETGYII